jgi:hypothetical protein
MKKKESKRVRRWPTRLIFLILVVWSLGTVSNEMSRQQTEIQSIGRMARFDSPLVIVQENTTVDYRLWWHNTMAGHIEYQTMSGTSDEWPEEFATIMYIGEVRPVCPFLVAREYGLTRGGPLGLEGGYMYFVTCFGWAFHIGSAPSYIS